VHSYEVPEVVATPIVGGSANYLAWVEAETSTSADEPS
jgi:periplasmic divalent cation tolerance protein